MYKLNKRMLKVENLIKNTPPRLHNIHQRRDLLKTPSNSKTEISAKTAKDIQPLIVFAKNSIPEAWRGSSYML